MIQINFKKVVLNAEPHLFIFSGYKISDNLVRLVIDLIVAAVRRPTGPNRAEIFSWSWSDPIRSFKFWWSWLGPGPTGFDP